MLLRLVRRVTGGAIMLLLASLLVPFDAAAAAAPKVPIVLAILTAAGNTITTRSDVFCVWFVVHGYAPEDVADLEPTDADVTAREDFRKVSVLEGIVGVQKQPDANTIDVTARLDRELDALQQELPAGITIDRRIFRQADFISASVNPDALLWAVWSIALWLGAADERIGYAYLLRVIGFVLILVAIIDKNRPGRG